MLATIGATKVAIDDRRLQLVDPRNRTGKVLHNPSERLGFVVAGDLDDQFHAIESVIFGLGCRREYQ